jgi:hypothetical protein
VRRIVTLAALFVLVAVAASAQVTPAAGYTASDDTPSIKIGVVFYGDYTYTQNPQSTDSDLNLFNPSQFNVSRSYLNITGNISHIVAFRITPDITRESGLVSLGTGSSVSSDSLVFRIKYAFAQFNLDDWMAKGSWARLGIQQTPWVDFEENIYRYRFQGTVFSEREGFLSSSDAGASFHYNFPSNYGDFHVGVYNGETYSKVEVNNQKALQFRATVRPFATSAVLPLRGFRAHLFYDGDSYVKDAERRRVIGSVTFEHQYLNAGFDYLDAKDQTSITKPDLEGKGWSVWFTPRSPKGFEGLIRYDHMKPNTLVDTQERNRTILGVSYWFPHQGSVSTALLLDYDGQTFQNFTPALPAQKKIAVHALLSF